MRSNNRLNLLATPLFVCSVALLFANDFFFKSLFHNWLTGKLSDVAGLVAVAIIGCAFFPKGRLAVAVTLSCLFALWKSQYSQSLIDIANIVLPYRIGRTVDYTDLIALPAAWMACLFVPRLRSWPARRWIVQSFAGVSVMVFGATSMINAHGIREIADFSLPGSPVATRTESELTAIVDEFAARHNLQCTVCDALSLGRVYGSRDFGGMSISTAYDPEVNQLFYEIRVTDFGEIPAAKAKEVDAMRGTLDKALRSTFSQVKVTAAQRPAENVVQLGVYRKNLSTTNADNERDHAKALTAIEEIANKYRLKRNSSFGQRGALYYTGRLFGSTSNAREFTLTAGTGSGEPLVTINVTCSSPRFDELQQSIVRELESKLKNEFGDDRAKIRTWFVGRCN